MSIDAHKPAFGGEENASMAFGNTQEMLIKLRADTGDARRELNETKGVVAGLGGAAGPAAGALASLANPITLAAAAATALATAGVAAASALYNLTQRSADYAGAVFDVQEKTGLSAAALSALKVNAELAGSTLENVGNGAAKFAKTIGEAAGGSEKAQKILADLGVTSYDLETALGQAVSTINDAEAGTDQLSLAMKAFGKTGGDLIGTIKQMGGDLKGATAEAEKLGLVMSEKDLAAADAFGDSLALLGNQAKVAGVAFTSQLMPIVAKYFGMASKWIGENRELIRTWGTYVASVVANLARGIAVSVNFIIDNANALRAVLATITFGISELVIQAAKLLGMYYKAKGLRSDGDAQEGAGGSGISIASLIPSGSSGSPKAGGGGGGDPAAEAEKRRKAEVDAAQKSVNDTLEVYRVGYDKRQAMLESLLSRGEILEIEKVRDTARIRLEALMDERRLLEDRVLNNQKLNLSDGERLDILRRIKILQLQADIEKLKAGVEINAQVQKEIEKKERLLELERTRRREARDERKRLDAIESADKNASRDAAARDRNYGGLSVLGDSALSVRNDVGNLKETISPMVTIAQMAGQAFQSLAQGVGQVVQNLVLMGNAGPQAMRKLVASVLASTAAQAATLAIMETAYAIAALTPWGRALYGNPVNHFKAAALFASVALGTGVAGRAIAGNSFQSGSGGGAAGGGGGAESAGNRPGLVFTERFGGFVQEQQSFMAKATDRMNLVVGRVSDVLDKFSDKFLPVAPDTVLMAAAGTSSGQAALLSGLTDGLIADGSMATNIKRAMGDY